MNKKILGIALLGLSLTAGTFVSCKDYDDDIQNLQSQINKMTTKDDVDKTASELKALVSSTISGVDAKIKAAQDVADAAKAAAGDAQAAAKAAEEAAAKVADELNPKIEALAADLEAAKAGAAEAVSAAILKLETELKAAQDAVEAAKQAAAAAQVAADAKASKDDVVAAIDKAIEAQKAVDAAQNAKLEELLKAIEDVQKQLANVATQKNLDELAAKLKDIESKFGDVTGVVGKRLTSLVYAPTTYINGIEAIKFSNLQYEAWANRKADAPKSAKYFNVDKVGATAEYYVSPAGVTLNGIEKLEFLLNDAKNTRAAADVELTVASQEIKNGKLVLGLKKNAGKLPAASEVQDPAFSKNNPESMVIASLKATLAESVKTAAEVEAKADVAVFSDWARLVEETVTPYIHNSLIRHTDGTIDGNVDDVTPFAVDGKDSHFWAFSEIYHNTAADKDVYTDVDEKKFIAIDWIYSKPLDLMTLVTVCDKNETEYKNYADYGLSFEFNVMNYIVKNQGGTLDNTDQKYFALLDGTILQSTARDNKTTLNADAVGRTPVIQVVLKDDVNGKDVDVRYFKVRWTAADPSTTPWVETELPAVAYDCADAYEAYILEEYMNNLYAKIVEGGMTKEQFHATYNFKDKNLYPGKVTDAVVKDVAEMTTTQLVAKYKTIGSVEDVIDATASTQTHNIKVSFNTVNPKAEQDFEKEGFFVYETVDGASKIIIPVKLVVKAGKFSYLYNYFRTQWNMGDGTPANNAASDAAILADSKKYRNINPTLYSDDLKGNKVFKTTQLDGDLAFGYIKDFKAPTSITDLIGYTPYKGKIAPAASDIIFDQSRLGELPAKNIVTGKATKWEISKDGKKLYDMNAATGEQLAAVIEGNDAYLVDDKRTNNTTGAIDAEPTTAALTLVDVKVPVVVNATNCEGSVFDQYYCYYIKPLIFTSAQNSIELIDVKNGASSKAVGIQDLIKLKENFGQNSAEIYIFGPNKTKADNLVLLEWYEIEDDDFIKVDANNIVQNAKTNLNGNGGKDATCKTELLKIKNAAGDPSYTIKYNKATDELSFHNASGNAIAKGDSFQVEVPVVVNTKWQKGLEAVIKITIKSGL